MAQGHSDRGPRQAEGGPDVGGAQAEYVRWEAAAGHDHVVVGIATGRGERDQRQDVPCNGAATNTMRMRRFIRPLTQGVTEAGERARAPSAPSVRSTAQFSWRERAQSAIALLHMATFRSASVLLSADGTRTPGTAALFAEAARKGGVPPWAGDFRPANSAGNGPKNAVGKTFTLELPDGSTGKVVVQSLKQGKGGVVLALMGEDAPPF
jgi:hypothetical protein